MKPSTQTALRIQRIISRRFQSFQKNLQNQSEARTHRRQRNHLQPCKHRHQPRDRGAAGVRAGISPSRAMGSISMKAMSKGSPRGISSYHTCTSHGCWGLWELFCFIDWRVGTIWEPKMVGEKILVEQGTNHFFQFFPVTARL